MQQPSKNKAKLCIAISSRALFDLEESHQVFLDQGAEQYMAYQRDHENKPLEKGTAFRLVEKCLRLNQFAENSTEVILVSRNSSDTGVRIFNSIEHYQLPITRACFSNGASPFPYLKAFQADLFLSSHQEDVGLALQAQHAAALLLPSKSQDNGDDTLKIAFDGDAVLFSDESEKIYQQSGFASFAKNELEKANTPLPKGPFAGFLKALYVLQQELPIENCPVRTALVTARSAPAHERVIRTLRSWGIRLDEAMFLGGLNKGAFLSAFGADIFFDDQHHQCLSASQHVPTGHVSHGIMNTPQKHDELEA